MKRGVLLFAVFVGALVLAVGGWLVDGARWLLTVPVRRVRAAVQSEGGLAS